MSADETTFRQKKGSLPWSVQRRASTKYSTLTSTAAAELLSQPVAYMSSYTLRLAVVTRALSISRVRAFPPSKRFILAKIARRVSFRRQASSVAGATGVAGLGFQRDAPREDGSLVSMFFAAHSPSLSARTLGSISSLASPMTRFCFDAIFTTS